jgi:hypothetical protein
MDSRIEQLIVAGRLQQDLRAAADARLAKEVARGSRRPAGRARPRRRFVRDAAIAARRVAR